MNEVILFVCEKAHLGIDGVENLSPKDLVDYLLLLMEREEQAKAQSQGLPPPRA